MGLMVARHDMTTTKDCDFQCARLPLPVAQDWSVESCEPHSASEGFRFLIDLVGKNPWMSVAVELFFLICLPSSQNADMAGLWGF